MSITIGKLTARSEGTGPFGIRLKAERMRRQMSIRELSSVIGICDSQITAWENRGVFPTLHMAAALATALDCSIDFLMGLED